MPECPSVCTPQCTNCDKSQFQVRHRTLEKRFLPKFNILKHLSHDHKMAGQTLVPNVCSVFREDLFHDKVAIVTGGGTGIGKTITQELLHLGCKVMIASRKVERLKKAVTELKSTISRSSLADIDYLQCNIRNEDEVKNLMSQTIKQFGGINFLVNNGGGQFPSGAGDIRLKGWNAVVETNLTGTFLCCREVFNQWFKDHGGVIVNIIVDNFKGFPLMSHSGAARAGVENLTKSLSIEWAEYGVRINSVAPGGGIYSETAAANYANPTMIQSSIPRVPAKRNGTTEEISASVCFLLSPAATFISGETLRVDGGASLYKNKYEIPEHNKLPGYTWEKDLSSKL
ncbi:hypothetical protein KUTeg_015331 [Tegillarca granosa]|uniref:Peroxisomal trans-2-enoyl-CoA reductase n=1 Tax=Tegillarca granosa TaxID=220873 RepID=A0ABQ9ETF3_TEGGR|nr:hypothetical protein KUTeg_015331 [Tegillarca granosa]